MNLILIEPNEWHLDRRGARLGGRKAHHLKSILKVELGQALRVGELGGRLGEGIVIGVGSDFVDLSVELKSDPPSPIRIAVLMALPRPKAFRRTLQSLVTLGVKQIVFFNAARVEKSYWTSEFLSAPSINEQVILGLEQCGDTVQPEISFRNRFRPFFEDEVPAILSNRTGWFAHPGSDLACPQRPAGEHVIVIGPEGGFVPFELDLLQSLGFMGVRLGERILKSETAAVAMISRFMEV